MSFLRTWFGIARDIQRRTVDLNGTYAASALTLSVFVSQFPLTLLIISIAGLASRGNPHVALEIIDRLALNGQAAELVRQTLQAAHRTGSTGSIIALIGMAWLGLPVRGSRRAWRQRRPVRLDVPVSRCCAPAAS